MYALLYEEMCLVEFLLIMAEEDIVCHCLQHCECSANEAGLGMSLCVAPALWMSWQ